jgi:hypothetical protein
MKTKKGRVVHVLVLIAAALLCAQMAYALLDVQVVKNDIGIEPHMGQGFLQSTAAGEHLQTWQ